MGQAACPTYERRTEVLKEVLEADHAAKIAEQGRRPLDLLHAIVSIELDDQSAVFPDQDEFFDRRSSDREHPSAGRPKKRVDFRACHSLPNRCRTKRPPTGDADQPDHSEQYKQGKAAESALLETMIRSLFAWHRHRVLLPALDCWFFSVGYIVNDDRGIVNGLPKRKKGARQAA